MLAAAEVLEVRCVGVTVSVMFRYASDEHPTMN